MGPELLRVQGPLPGPQVEGPGDVPTRLEVQGPRLAVRDAAAALGGGGVEPAGGGEEVEAEESSIQIITKVSSS